MGLRLVSLMAPNADPTYAAIAEYLAQHTDLLVEWRGDAPWTERQQWVEQGEAEIVFMCGAPYVRNVERRRYALDVLVAPVMRAERYRRRPVYFSDVVVPAASPVQTFADLRGARWVYNEPQSYSGYHVVCAYLAMQGAAGDFFGRSLESGSHQASLRMLLAGAGDAAAIDSIVLEREYQQDPTLADELRVITTLGPSPIPPVVCAGHVPADVRRTLRECFVKMHRDRTGQQILHDGLLDRFVPTADAAYDGIREQLKRGSAVQLVA